MDRDDSSNSGNISPPAADSIFPPAGPAGWDVEEQAAAGALPEATGLSVGQRRAISQNAAALVERIRQTKSGGGAMSALLAEFELSSEEGVALLCVAEAILRVPDDETADLLIAGKLAGPAWSKHMGAHHPWFANAAAAALLATEGIVKPEEDPQAAAGVFRRLVRRVGEPLVRRAVRAAVATLGRQFIYAEDIGGAVKKSAAVCCSFDMLGEGARTMADAETYYAAYQQAVAAAASCPPQSGRHGVSIKLSALHPRFEATQRGRVMDELTPKVIALARQAAAADIPLTIDAEEMARFDLTMEVLDVVAADSQTQKWAGLGCALQAYSKRAPEAAATVADIARRHRRRLMPRLVKGAYWDTEIKIAQERGLAAYPVFTVKAHTDACFLACARALLEARDVLHPCFATHNAHTAAAVLQMAGGAGGWEFQRLHGMGAELYAALAEDGVAAPRIYAPVGGHRDLLAYLVRRLLENGANTSFIAGLRRLPVQRLAADPLSSLGQPSALPPPCGYIPSRRVAGGLDLSRADHLKILQEAVARCPKENHTAAPADGLPRKESAAAINPATGGRVGRCCDATADTARQAMEAAVAAQPNWNAQPVAERRDIFLRAAAAMEADLPRLAALVTGEGGRALQDAVAEVREAVDFLRYYAITAAAQFSPRTMPGPTGEHNTLTLEGRGVFLCISPWNFPLAIFCGQVSAALIAGNAALAKPAEQTPLCAAAAVSYLHNAGVPRAVLQLLPGDGEALSSPLLADARLAGVAFTGSGAVARHIARRLAERDGPLPTFIAETGGINAMMVDTSALAEQVTRDVVDSAFRSAGQRCSSLRALYIQKECAARQIEMIAGAMAELTLGDPADAAVDVGPLIDGEAKANVESWLRALPEMRATLLAQTPLPARLPKGNFVAPQLWRLPDLRPPPREVFGPVLHVASFEVGKMDEVLAHIAATGHALTFSLHSRCERRIAEVSAKAAAGNVYINRNQIGALVESQPFGGYAHSGTGPKAGGPHYLARFARERAVSRDTTAAGGNVHLVAGEGAPAA